MDIAQQVKVQFADFSFGAPCTEADLLRAEHELGEPVPNELRALYLNFDGFAGSANAQFFWPLFGQYGLVGFNRFLRTGAEFPHQFVSSCVFFGDNGVGSMWGVYRNLPDQVILWDANWGEKYRVVGSSPLEVWTNCKEEYDALDANPDA